MGPINMGLIRCNQLLLRSQLDGISGDAANAVMSAADPLIIAQELLRCPSVTPAEGGALRYLETLLQGAGFTVHRMTFSEPGTDDIENLYARIGTAPPNIVFAGHTDVVPTGDVAGWKLAPFAGEIADGQL